ncbi:unnamed protein product [Chondrus crispus]|uniref:Uncharacterized protein n=1 Tax=Chondrus crispus TaxID=2769 RepID=R7QKK3_CHOCR|nr:unnamed protein product [Chondrus crispus]CDF37986.1 unnamed protein product [Chondrus crispus]|eukprot:XP_005717855.1 unnamed protein product [Chondrus crispus]
MMALHKPGNEHRSSVPVKKESQGTCERPHVDPISTYNKVVRQVTKTRVLAACLLIFSKRKIVRQRVWQNSHHTENWGHVSFPRVSHPPDHSSAGSTRLEGKRSGLSVLFVSANESQTARVVSICVMDAPIASSGQSPSMDQSTTGSATDAAEATAKDRQVEASKKRSIPSGPPQPVKKTKHIALSTENLSVFVSSYNIRLSEYSRGCTWSVGQHNNDLTSSRVPAPKKGKCGTVLFSGCTHWVHPENNAVSLDYFFDQSATDKVVAG